MTQQLLTYAQAGDMFAIANGALAQFRYLGSGPHFVRVRVRSIRYRPQDLDEWIEANLHMNAASHA